VAIHKIRFLEILEVLLGRGVADLRIDRGVNQGEVANAVDVLVARFAVGLQKLPWEDVMDGSVFADDVLAGPVGGVVAMEKHVEEHKVLLARAPAQDIEALVGDIRFVDGVGAGRPVLHGRE